MAHLVKRIRQREISTAQLGSFARAGQVPAGKKVV
jgi:hypothetical protein